MRWTSSILCSKQAEAFIKMYLQHSFLPFSLLEHDFSHLSLLISPPSRFCAVLSHPLRILLLSLFPFRFPSHIHPSLFLLFAFLIFLFHPVIPLHSQLHALSLCLFHPAPYSSVALLLFIYLFFCLYSMKVCCEHSGGWIVREGGVLLPLQRTFPSWSFM